MLDRRGRCALEASAQLATIADMLLEAEGDEFDLRVRILAVRQRQICSTLLAVVAEDDPDLDEAEAVFFGAVRGPRNDGADEE